MKQLIVKIPGKQSQGLIYVFCSIDKKCNIPTDSKFYIYCTDILGDKAVKIELGKSKNYIQNNDTIPINSTISNSLIDSVGFKVKDFINELTDQSKQDSILLELRRLNDNLEKMKK